MYTNNKLSKAVRLAFAFGAASATAFTASVNAQEEDAAAKVERIEVTGSRLRQTDLEGANPVTIVTGEQMVNLGIVDVGAFIQRMPAMSGSPIGTTTNNGGTGSVTVNLRGLGAGRTLVLVNGRRTVDGGDFQTIPTSSVKRIEILKEGSSTIYGADAVAGVVNVILKDDVEGVHIGYQRKSHFDVSAGDESSFNINIGKSFNGGHVVFGADYATQEEIYQGDVNKVEFLQNPWYIDDPEAFRERGLVPSYEDDYTVFNAGSSSAPCGWFEVAGISGAQTLAACQAADNGASWDGSTYSNRSAADFRTYSAATDSYNYAPVNYLQTPYEKLNIFTSTEFEVNDNVRAFAEVRVNHRKSSQELASTPFFSIYDTPGLTIGANNYYNPFDAEVTGFRRRIVEGNRRFENEVTQLQSAVGFEGMLMDRFSWNVSYNYGQRHNSTVDYGQLYSPNLGKALGPSFLDTDGVVKCGTADDIIDGCVPFDMFGGVGAISQEMLEYVQAPLTDSTTSTLEQLNGDISGDVFELPAGAMQLAVGYEYRREALRAEVDSGKFMEQVSGNVGKGVSGSFVANSIYAETLIPVLADMPGADMLEVKFGARRDDYSTFGAETTLMAGFRWQPVTGVLVRGTFGDVYRAPTIGQLLAPASDSFPPGSDPCRQSNWAALDSAEQQRCVATGAPAGGVDTSDTQVRASIGGNRDLQPETGESFTLGVVWSPEFLDGFSATVDYWKFDIEGVIQSIGAVSTMNGCYIGGVQSLCDNIARFPTADGGRIDSIQTAPSNQANMLARGIDTELKYNFSTSFGDFRTFLGWTHLLDREDTEFGSVGFSVKPLLGRHDGDRGDTYAENKFNLSVDYFVGDWSLSYAMEYIGGIDYEAYYFAGSHQFNEDLGFDQYVSGEMVSVDAQIYHDISAAYDFSFGTRVSAGITNLTGENPPYIDAGFNGATDPSTYRLFGRSWFLRLSHSF